MIVGRLTEIVVDMEGQYGKGKWCREQEDGEEQCLEIRILRDCLDVRRIGLSLVDVMRQNQTTRPQ